MAFIAFAAILGLVAVIVVAGIIIHVYGEGEQ